jgi:hypothetical protein
MNEYTPRHRDNVGGRAEHLTRERLFPPPERPSFLDVVGPEATAEYTREMDSRRAQEIANASRARAARRAGRRSIELTD